ncbi:jacalin-related lectin 3-like [Panicum miliaceum]|uniref:Jacalin-related lectin 3-like n=1 Tax=Panicum miliaceum TaxID=4540 RepID=A0A3L6PKB9_PANMI|nr:jacalin-related lectin 3-like [Panicum miliaceum]
MAKLKLSGAAVLLIIVVPLFMYTGALLIGIQLGRALERRPDSGGVSFSIRGALAYLAKELWGTNRNIWGSGGRRGRGRDGSRVEQVVWVPFPASRSIRYESSAANTKQSKQQQQQPYIPVSSSVVQGRDNTSTANNSKTHGHHSNHTWPGGVISVGPWGGSGGQPFYMRGPSAPRLRSITLHHSISGIHSLACEYSLPGDEAAANRIRTAGPWGRHRSAELHRATIKLSAGEQVTAVEGTIGRFGGVPDLVITSLTFRSSTGRTYGPYGSTVATGTPLFSVPAADGASIVGFWGRSGWLLDAIGVYVKPSTSIVKPGRLQDRQYTTMDMMK